MMQVKITVYGETSSWSEEKTQLFWELIEGHTQLGDLSILSVDQEEVEVVKLSDLGNGGSIL